jgi:hypothetical protein
MFGLFKKKQAAPEPIEPQEPDYATLYVPDPSRLRSEVLDRLKGVKSYEGLSENGTATGLRLRFKDAEVAMNFMPPHLMDEHLAGMSGFAEQMVRDKTRLPYVQQRISQVKLVIGCVITPGFDDGDKVFEALIELNSQLNSMLFLGDSLIDHNAEPLAGSACDS